MGATGSQVHARTAIPPSSPAPPANVLLPDDRVFVTVVHSIAIAITMLRLARRIRIRLLSWDDGWAAFSAILVVVFLIVDWVKWVSIEDKALIMDAAEYRGESMAVVSALMALSLGVICTSLLPAERRLILVLFASGFLNLIACCVRTAFTINGGDAKGLSYSINLQMATAVIVCNFLVVITTLFRLIFWRKRTATEAESDEEYNSGERTIDLGRTRDGTTRTRTWGLTLTTIESTHSTGDWESQFTELDELQERTNSLRSCASATDSGIPPDFGAEATEGGGTSISRTATKSAE
ncbi:hypothetical protein PM082_000828 [Marasmius tenuissimus]|nr:hypothetical protein PM082_000828 [Marasmius tenuissimus]